MFKKSVYNSIVLIIVLLSVNACKKDKLEGDYAVFEGRWKWAYTIRHSSFSQNNYSDTIFQNETGKHFEIEFFKKGKLVFYENNKEIEKYRIVFLDWHEGNNGNSSISMYRDNKKDLRMGLYLDKNKDKNANFDTLGVMMLTNELGMPCVSGADRCIYANYFIREK